MGYLRLEGMANPFLSDKEDRPKAKNSILRKKLSSEKYEGCADPKYPVYWKKRKESVACGERLRQ